MINNKTLMVIMDELKEGRNYITVNGISKSEFNSKLIEMEIESSTQVEEKLLIFNDVNRSNGIVRKLIKATIGKEGEKVYNLNEIVGHDVIIDIEKATSKNGNEFWKVKGFEKVDNDTDLSEFEFINENSQRNCVEEVDDIPDFENILE